MHIRFTNWVLRAAMLFAALTVTQLAFAQLWTESFEVDGEGTAYTSSNTFNDGPADHFGRTDGTNVTGGYTGQNGTFFWAGEDLDDNGGDLDPSKTLTFAAIDVTGATSLEFRGLFATGTPDGGWDDSDVFMVEYNMDAAGWNTLLAMTTDLPGSNQGMYYDTNNDGIGDLMMTATFQQLIIPIPVTGTILELRVSATANSGGEQFAFDNFQVFDGAISVPGCTDPAADNYNPGATVDDGSCIYSGCTDSTALNYDSNANNDDGSCIFTLPNLVINEIHYNGNDGAGYPDSDYEFLEIYNNDVVSVDLEGYYFVGVTFTFPAATTIAPGEYVVIALLPATYSGNGYQVFGFTGALGNSGETVQLFDSNDLLVDEVAYSDTGDWSSTPDGAGPSLELINPDMDNNLGASWCGAGPDNGTPGAQSSCFALIVNGCTNPAADNYDSTANVDDGSCIIGGCTDTTATNYDPTATYDNGSCTYVLPDLVINEIHYNPCVDQGDDLVYEFIEIYNNDVVAIDLTDYQIVNAFVFTFPAASSIAPGEYIVIAIDATAYSGNGYQVFQMTSGGLNNTSEPVTLVNASGQTVDEVTYADTTPWPSQPDGFCPSLELIDPLLDNADAANWQASWVPNGTPGAENSTAPPATSYTINELQTVDHSSELIAVTGVVTAVYASSNLFTIQESQGAYSGIWVEGSGVALGDEVDVEGVVIESFDLTLITGTTIVVQTSGNALPTPEVLTTLGVNNEQWEGVLVVTIGEVDNSDLNFGEWSINDGSGSAVIDDLGILAAPADLGVTFEVTGPLYYSFGAYKIEPRDDIDIVRYGCTDSAFANYDPLAEVDDASCGNIPGCTNPNATNYDSTATIDDGSCIVFGCTDDTALNYDVTATDDDGSCYFTEPYLVINEIHYNPCLDQGDDLVFEFLEIYNNDVITVDLSGYTFAQGFTFTFPEGASIAPDEYIVLAVDAATYSGNGYQVFQIEFGNLGNSGSTVELQDAWGNVIDLVTYDDIAPWPTSPDGFCPSLELIDPSTDNNDGTNWQGSWVDNGTPGAQNSTPPAGCTDPAADNYDSTAVVEDGSCEYWGCMDTTASNYDSTANVDDGSCIYPGCTYPEAINYDSMANDDDGSCTFELGSPCPTDLNNDGITNSADLLLFLGQFGAVCGS
ncbi:MAG: lamin tail domain-containing protein [Flavobacteriales bacterium]|nr:lamin tail domain-containing protein [Flavobacteriales bacterium]